MSLLHASADCWSSGSEDCWSCCWPCCIFPACRPRKGFGMVWWLVDVGLFMLWQPFVHAERRLAFSSLSSFLLILAAGIWGYGDWLLLLWTAFVAALVAGVCCSLSHRATRIFYLLAFAYLLVAVLFHLVPRVVPNPGAAGELLETLFVWQAGPHCRDAVDAADGDGRAQAVGPVDFCHSLFVFLLIAVLVLGSLAFMVIQGWASRLCSARLPSWAACSCCSAGPGIPGRVLAALASSFPVIC